MNTINMIVALSWGFFVIESEKIYNRTGGEGGNAKLFSNLTTISACCIQCSLYPVLAVSSACYTEA